MAKKAGKATIFLRDTQNYVHVYRRISVSRVRRANIERAMTIFGHCHNRFSLILDG